MLKFACNDLFKKCLHFPVPVIAAINGHAFGNGDILACACDFRFMNQEKGFFYFPEVDIHIPYLLNTSGDCTRIISNIHVIDTEDPKYIEPMKLFL
ncbi:MAG: enoyl-CoA hydratase/isomerase family protein [Desulfobacteraceae bacterium]|nr:MAG: enoyl-CoA hydratase/isomerase family protein [Desulfobacteraceae bacterium]